MSNVTAKLVETRGDGRVTLSLSGRLDAYSVADAWKGARLALERNPAMPVVVDASGVEYCDGAGIALLVDLLRQPRSEEAKVTVRHLPDHFQPLLAPFNPESFTGATCPVPPRLSHVEQVGRAAAEVVGDLRDQVAFVGEAGAALVAALRHPGRVRWKDTLDVAVEAGANALPIVALISFLMGVILAFQSAVAMKQFGAEIFVANLLGLSLLRELGPLMTAILMAGRSAAAFAAEIGTMKVNEEIDALTTMGLDPVRFLAVPRIIAAVAVTPLLTVFADVVGLFGGGLVMRTFDIPWVTYSRQLTSAVDLEDLSGGLIKACVFGVLVAGIGCLRGLQTQTGASAVGISTTRAVVSAIILLVAVDGVFAVMFYYLDF